MNKQLFQYLLGLGIAISFGMAILTTGNTARADEAPAAAQQLAPMQFARGAKTWADNCARCHNMRNAKELRDDQWRTSIAHMRVRGGLTGKEARDVLVFLQGSN